MFQGQSEKTTKRWFLDVIFPARLKTLKRGKGSLFEPSGEKEVKPQQRKLASRAKVKLAAIPNPNSSIRGNLAISSDLLKPYKVPSRAMGVNPPSVKTNNNPHPAE